MSHTFRLRFFILLILGLLQTLNIDAQETNANQGSNSGLKADKLKISGYAQIQYRYIQGNEPDSRFMIRRGRIKFTYEFNHVTLVVNPDFTERKFSLRDTYIEFREPWLNVFSVSLGVLSLPFGYEVKYSSSNRESPERAFINQTLFPGERDLGLCLNVKAPEKSAFNGLELDVAVLNGSANVTPEFDRNKDFLERLSFNRNFKNNNINLGLGLSNYHGGYTIGMVKDFIFEENMKRFQYSPDTADYYRIAKRNYTGADVQFSVNLGNAGKTTLRAEYCMGGQAGTANNSRSAEEIPAEDIYHRKFTGAYFYFVQDIGRLPLQLVAKYDWFDQNSVIAGKEIGVVGTNTNKGDIRYDTYGLGLTIHLNKHAKLTGYYEFVRNESTLLPGYETDLKDDRMTIRAQIKF